MSKSLVLLVLLVLPSVALAQGPRAAPAWSGRAVTWGAWDSTAAQIAPEAVAMPAPSPHRLRNALIGGAIGTAAGLVVCTAISNITDDAGADRFTTCTAKGYLLTGGVGFGAGFLIGWLVSS